MKSSKLIILLFLLMSSLRSFATAQAPDKLIYKGDTLLLFANPLEELYTNNSSRPKLFVGGNSTCASTGCWRGYQAEWTILNKQLYLTGIFSCCFYEDGLKADLKALFGNKFIDGKVKADWVNSNIIAPKGKLLYYVHQGYNSLYEKELELQFVKGKLIGSKTYDNSKSKQTIYSQSRGKLYEFIYPKVNWSDLPDIGDKIINISVQFSANVNGVIDSIRVIKDYDHTFDQEAIRVISTIPEWDVVYRHGKHIRGNSVVNVTFSEAHRRKYNK
jgi:hypothetical protein